MQNEKEMSDWKRITKIAMEQMEDAKKYREYYLDFLDRALKYPKGSAMRIFFMEKATEWYFASQHLEKTSRSIIHRANRLLEEGPISD